MFEKGLCRKPLSDSALAYRSSEGVLARPKTWSGFLLGTWHSSSPSLWSYSTNSSPVPSKSTVRPGSMSLKHVNQCKEQRSVVLDQYPFSQSRGFGGHLQSDLSARRLCSLSASTGSLGNAENSENQRNLLQAWLRCSNQHTEWLVLLKRVSHHFISSLNLLKTKGSVFILKVDSFARFFRSSLATLTSM